MDTPAKKTSALGLCSGGLDSILAALILKEQDINVHWIAFETPFFGTAKAVEAAEMTGIPLRVENITADYLKMLRNPPCGYGRNMNPCMDCHALMFRLAGDIMSREGYDFLFSGEVMGQRPMSQTRTSLRYVEKNSVFDGRILRPLSAKKLPETPMETAKIVDRERLMDFSGRSRKPQIALAKRFGITAYPTPAGGCLLTEAVFSKRLKDLFTHQKAVAENELHLLKYGRHFRLNPEARMIVGRTKADNEAISNRVDVKTHVVLKVRGIPGPTAVFIGHPETGTIALAAAICAGYSKADISMPVTVQVDGSGNRTSLSVFGLPAAVSMSYRIE